MCLSVWWANEIILKRVVCLRRHHRRGEPWAGSSEWRWTSRRRVLTRSCFRALVYCYSPGRDCLPKIFTLISQFQLKCLLLKETFLSELALHNHSQLSLAFYFLNSHCYYLKLSLCVYTPMTHLLLSLSVGTGVCSEPRVAADIE